MSRLLDAFTASLQRTGYGVSRSQSVSWTLGLQIRSHFFSYRQSMIDSFARVSGWQQLYHLWELIVMLCKFLWGLLRLLGGG
jgi:hypothetical protein